MIKLKDLLEASKTGTTSSSEQLGGYKGFVKEEDFDKYKKYMGNKAPKGSILVEGVDDPGILKCVFLAGGPGSGKTYVAKGLFGIPDKVNVSQGVDRDSIIEVIKTNTEVECYEGSESST